MIEETIQVEIPVDNEGFVLLQCPFCGEFFKLKPSDSQAEDVIDIWCPSCGLQADNYLTDDVIELALNTLRNHVIDSLYKEAKKLERKTKNKGNSLRFKAGKRPRHVKENSIVYAIDTLEQEYYRCCCREAKIAPIYKSVGSYCPFCGVRK